MHDSGNGGGRPVGSGASAGGADQPGFLALERELTVLLRRARAN
ncbi:MarR family transcriptional regulator, partial [Streptomyces sp. TRM76130]|nr:MarR family transcriptional regulator [Streptomyces sp. TRM76130]